VSAGHRFQGKLIDPFLRREPDTRNPAKPHQRRSLRIRSDRPDRRSDPEGTAVLRPALTEHLDASVVEAVTVGQAMKAVKPGPSSTRAERGGSPMFQPPRRRVLQLRSPACPAIDRAPISSGGVFDAPPDDLCRNGYCRWHSGFPSINYRFVAGLPCKPRPCAVTLFKVRTVGRCQGMGSVATGKYPERALDRHPCR